MLIKKILKFTAVIIITAVGYWNYQQKIESQEVSGLLLENVESLAACEVCTSSPNNGVCLYDPSTHEERCANKGSGPACCATISIKH